MGNDEENFINVAFIKLAEAMHISNLQNLKIDILKKTTPNIISWFDRFEILTDRWKSEDRAVEIAKYFDDNVLEVYRQIPLQFARDYHGIKEMMLKKLRPHDHELKAKTAFYAAKQQPGESAEQYSRRLKKYISECNERDREGLKIELKEIFKSGVNANIRSFLIGTKSCDFQELVQLASEVERSRGSVEDEFTINAIEEENICAINKAEENKSNSRGNKSCAFCNEAHLMMECMKFKEWMKQISSEASSASTQQNTGVRFQPVNRNASDRNNTRYNAGYIEIMITGEIIATKTKIRHMNIEIDSVTTETIITIAAKAVVGQTKDQGK
jgi:hypothetical protein